MKITKKRAIELIKNGINQEDFECLLSEIDSCTLFDASTYEPGGHGVELYLNGKPVSGFQKHFGKLLELNGDNSEHKSPIPPTKANRVTYYIYLERFYKRVHWESKLTSEFSLDKISLFFPSTLRIGELTLSGFEFMYDNDDLEEASSNFSGDEIYIIDSNGKIMKFEINE